MKNTIFRKVPISDKFPIDKSKEYFALHIYGKAENAGKFWWNGLSWSLKIGEAQSSIFESKPISSIFWLEEIELPSDEEIDDECYPKPRGVNDYTPLGRMWSKGRCKGAKWLRDFVLAITPNEVQK